MTPQPRSPRLLVSAGLSVLLALAGVGGWVVAAGPTLPIVPCAQGYGIHTAAGSGRHLDPPRTDIIRVTNTDASGPGSLKACIDAEGPRTCVFEVSGVIEVTDDIGIWNPYITIAGQTAPPPGIAIFGGGVRIRADHDSTMTGSVPTDLVPAYDDPATLVAALRADVGAWPAHRDPVDEQLIAHMVNGDGFLVNCMEPDGSTRCEQNPGGWPYLAETRHTLDIPVEPMADDDGDGYTNLENWLHWLASNVAEAKPIFKDGFEQAALP